MKTKIIGIFVCMLLILIIAPVSGNINFNNLNTDRVIFLEIDETRDKILIVDDVIGDIHVQYWEHVINDVFVKNDSILLHIDIDGGDVINYERSWTDVDFVLSDSLDEEFEPMNIFWKHLVVFPDENDCSYFYIFYEQVNYPIVCWEVRHTDGTTIIYDLDGRKIGDGVPAPYEIGFSLNGYDDEVGPNCWRNWRENADHWFKKWFDSTVSLASPSVDEISINIQNAKETCFYELAHSGGLPTRFQNDQFGYYWADQLKEDMANRQPMKFAFIGSCEGMRKIGSGTLSYEFRKGQMENTVTVGYIGMSSCPGWSVSLEWQDLMFFNMDRDLTIKESFDLASAYYPTIANCVRFVGDENLKIKDNPSISPGIDGPTLGKPSVTYSFSVYLYDPEDDSIFYFVDWGDNTSTDWIGPYNSNSKVNISHNWNEEGEYQIKVKAKGDAGLESDWSKPLEVQIIDDNELPEINFYHPENGFLYFFGEQKRETLLGGTVIVGEILIQFIATDNIAIDKIEFYIDNQLKYSDGDRFHYWNWDEKAFGKYNLTAIAYDWAGNTNIHEIDVWKFF